MKMSIYWTKKDERETLRADCKLFLRGLEGTRHRLDFNMEEL